jgi:hypothetical protein
MNIIMFNKLVNTIIMQVWDHAQSLVPYSSDLLVVLIESMELYNDINNNH